MKMLDASEVLARACVNTDYVTFFYEHGYINECARFYRYLLGNTCGGIAADCNISLDDF